MIGLKLQIAAELYKVIRRLGGDNELLSTVGSYGDTLDDDDVLLLLRAWNRAHPPSQATRQ